MIRVALIVWGLVALGLTVSELPRWYSSALSLGEAARQIPEFRLAGVMMAPVWVLTAAAGVLGILAAVYAAGWPAPRILGIGRSDRIILQFVCGWGVVSFVGHGAGLAGLLSTPLIRVGVVALTVAGIVLALRERVWRFMIHPKGSDRIAGVLVGILLVFTLVLCLLPDTHDDPRIYHLAAPEHYLLLHKINAEPQNVFFHIPLAFEMILMPAFALGGIECAKLLNVAVLIVIVGLLSRVARAVGFNAGAGLWAGVWFLSMGVVLDIGWQGKNDLAAALYFLAAAWCVVEAARAGPGWLVATGWFLGQALSVKLTAGMVAAGLTGAFLCFRWRTASVQRWVIAAGIGCMPLVTWFAASWLFLGNPAHPFLCSVFPDIGWSAALQEAWYVFDAGLRPPEAKSNWDMLAGVWRIFGDPDIGCLGLFVLLPAALGIARSRAPVLLAALALGYVLWAATGIERNPRYFLPAVPVVALLAGAAVAGVTGLNGALRSGLAVATVSLTLVHGASRFLSPDGGLYLAGQTGKAEFLSKRYTTWEAVTQWINRNVSPTSRINVSGEDRQLGINRRVRSFGAVVEPLFWKLTAEANDTKDVLKRLRQLGITHQLHNAIGAEFRAAFFFPGPEWDARQLALFKEVVRGHFKPVYIPDRVDRAAGAFYVFELTREPGDFPLFFLPFTEGRFRTARLLMLDGRPREALAEAIAAAGPVQDVLQTGVVLGAIRTALGDHDKALAALDAGFRAGLVSMWDRWNLSAYGAAAANTGRYDVGVAAMEKGLRVTDDDAFRDMLGRTLVLRGQSRELRGELSSALSDIRRALPLLSDPGMRDQASMKMRYLERKVSL